MRIRTVVLGIAALALVVVLAAGSAGAFALYAFPPYETYFRVGLLVVMTAGALLLGPVRRHTALVALLIGAVTVITGLAYTAADVAQAVDDRAVEVQGELNVRDILQNYHPSLRPDPRTVFERRGDAESSYLAAADGDTRKFGASSGLLRLWSLGELAPWLLAALSLVLVAPLLRSAGRGDPFLPSAARRLQALGAALLVGVPGIVVLQWMAADQAAGSGAAPIVYPSLTLSLLHVLPGLGLLVLAGVFRRGAELRDFERHAI